jgi:cytochrome c oxidase accessory protein FixG
MSGTGLTVEPPVSTTKPNRISLPGTNFHRVRKIIHLICFAIFVALPMSNVMRFDIPRQRFYFFGAELWINEFGIIFLSMMFLLFVVAAMAMIYGRFYCSYLCPQMIFSEASLDLQDWIRRRVNKKMIGLSPMVRSVIAATAFYTLLLIASVFLAFVFIAYFVEPRDLFHRLMSFDIRTAGGIAGATTTILTLLDFAFVRLKFCTTVCPYGYLQGILADDNTLLVHYRDHANSCIKCDKCVRICPMGIDIRNGPHQIECTHCAECVDACSTVLGKLGRPTLIEYAWGATESKEAQQPSWYQRIGLRDYKRLVLLMVMLLYASGLYVAVAMRQPVLVRLSADRSTLYKEEAGGRVSNHFRLDVSNRGHVTSAVTVAIDGLPTGVIEGLGDLSGIAPGSTVHREFDVKVDPAKVTAGVNHISFVTMITPGNNKQEFPMTFITPMESSTGTAK